MQYKYRKVYGLILVFIGILIIAIWLGIYASMLYERWYTFAIIYGKDPNGNFWEYFFAMWKFPAALAALVGSVPGITGLYLMFKKQ